MISPLEAPVSPAAGWVLVVSVVAMGLGLNIIAPALPLFGRDFGVGSTLVGLLIIAFGLSRVILNLPAGMLADRIAVVLTLVGFANAYSLLVVYAVVWGIGTGIGGPSSAPFMADLVPPRRMGMAMGLYCTSGDIGYFIGPLLLGWVADVA